MMAAPRYKAFLLLLIFDLLVKNCSGFHNLRQKLCHLNWRLKCAETGPTPTPSSKRSSMNEKMLERAKILREEASALESPKDAPVLANTIDLPEDNGGIKILRDEFVSRFPVERLTANTSIFTLGAFDSKEAAESSTSTEYVSVLVERDAEQKKQKLQLDKISGEATRKKSVGTSKREDVDNLIDIAIRQLSDAEPKLKKNAEPMSERKPISVDAVAAAIDYSNVTSIFVALNFLTDSTCPIISTSIEDALVKATDSNNEVVYELQDVDTFLKKHLAWYQREAFKLFSWMLYLAVDRDAIENKADFKFLEIACISYILDMANCGSEGEQRLYEDLATSFKSGNYHLRADFLKAMVTKSVPSVAELRRLSIVDAESLLKENDVSLEPQMALWRLTTLERLTSMDPSAVKQREIMWGIKNAPVFNTVIGSEGVALSTSILEDVVFKGAELEGEPVAAYQATIDDALAMRMNSLYISLVKTGEGRLSDEEGKAAALSMMAEYQAREKEGPVPSNLESLMYAISSYTSPTTTSTSTSSSTTSSIPVPVPVGAESMLNSTASNSDAGRKDLTEMSFEEISDVLKSDVDVTEFIEKYVKTTIDNAAEEFGETAAERFLYEYFDPASRRRGAMISRDGAGRFQGEMLKDLFVVSSVKMTQGAVIFDGKYKSKTSAEFVEKLNERYLGSRLAGEVGYIVMMNEKYPDAEGGLQQAALDSMLGRSPSVVVYPKNWNNTVTAAVTNPPKRLVKSALSSLAAVSSAAFAASCLNMFDPSSTFMMTGETPEDFLPLAFLPLTIQYASTLAETIAGNLKGFNVTSITVPALSLPTFGSRTVYTSMPKNRNDIFDTAAVGIIVGLSSSLLALFLGLQITAAASAEVAASYPSVSFALLKTNAIVTQFLSYQLPQAAIVAAETTKKVAIPGGLGFTTIDTSTVHLHWLAIAGAASLIANTYQLIPVDNSAGSKMIQAAIGKEAFLAVSLVTGAVKFLFILPLLFTLNAVTATGALSNTRLLVDYFITSQFSGNEEETQTATDSISDISEGRRIVLLGLMTLFFFSVVPYGEMGHRLFNTLSSFTEYIKVIAATGAVPAQNSLF